MALAITSITPSTGPQTGGTPIVITGTDLDDVTEVWIGGKRVQFTGTETEINTVTPSSPVPGTAVVRLISGIEVLDEPGGFTYTAVTNETLAAALARKFKVDVRAVGDTVWTALRGVNSLTPGIDTTTQDDSDFDSDGWASTVKTMLGWNLAAGLIRKYGTLTEAYDPGQEILRNASDKFGTGGLVEVRWYDREGGDEAYQGTASVQWEPAGGDTTALDIVNVTLLGQGKRFDITNPAA